MTEEKSALVIRQIEVCSRCGAGFACGAAMTEAEGKCWCAALPARTSPPDPAAGCLCPDCLRAELRAAGLLDATDSR